MGTLRFAHPTLADGRFEQIEWQARSPVPDGERCPEAPRAGL